MRRRITAIGDADVTTTWRRYEDLHLWCRWAPQIRAVEASAHRLAPGVRGIVHGPLGLAVPFHVDDVDLIRLTWRWTVQAAGIRVVMTHDLHPRQRGGATDGRGTVAGLTLDGPLPIVSAYAPVARHALRRLCRPDV